jgi:hypothetical protein
LICFALPLMENHLQVDVSMSFPLETIPCSNYILYSRNFLKCQKGDLVDDIQLPVKKIKSKLINLCFDVIALFKMFFSITLGASPFNTTTPWWSVFHDLSSNFECTFFFYDNKQSKIMMLDFSLNMLKLFPSFFCVYTRII